jgi:hypothetical protein
MPINFDAMRDSQKDLAYHVKQYYSMLKGHGFTSEEAILLVVAWQNAVLGVGK